MFDVDIFHLNKVVEIQRKFIDGEIDRKDLDKQLKEENERYIDNLRAESASIEAGLTMNSLLQEMDKRLKEKGILK